MSAYVREKVLRIPFEKMGTHLTEKESDIWDLEKRFKKHFGYGEKGKFQIAPTESEFVDFVLEFELGGGGEYGRTRSLTNSEKEKYLPVFQQICPDINMDDVRLVEFGWYDCCEAPDYYDETKDPFYDEL